MKRKGNFSSKTSAINSYLMEWKLKLVMTSWKIFGRANCRGGKQEKDACVKGVCVCVSERERERKYMCGCTKELECVPVCERHR
jgi:hypothetical protein